MNDIKIYEDSYEPYNIEEDDFLNATYHYIRRFGIKADKKGNRILNPKHIIISNSQIRINRSFFKRDIPLLRALEELPKEGTEDVLRMVFDSIYYAVLDKKEHADLDDKEFILIDDWDYHDS
jgi:hypothetical protein